MTRNWRTILVLISLSVLLALAISRSTAIEAGEIRQEASANASTTSTALSWTTSSTPLPKPLNEFGAAVWDDRIYVTGGNSGSYETISSDVYYSQINADGTLSAWTPTTSLPGVQNNNELVAMNGRLYMFGDGNATNNVKRAIIQSDGTLGSQWTSAAGEQLPHGRIRTAAVTHGNDIYVIGGWYGPSTINSVLRARANPDGSLMSPGWQAERSLPHALHAHAAAVLNGYLYVLGGVRDLSSDVRADVIAAEIMADGSLGPWNAVTSLPIPMYSIRAVAFQGQLVVVGGRDETASQLDTVYAASPTNDGSGGLSSWQTMEALPSPRVAHNLVATPAVMVSLGGSTSDVTFVANVPAVTGTTTRVSVDSAGVEGNDSSWSAGKGAFSGDNRLVVFSSLASNLVPNDGNGKEDVFVHDLVTGQTTRVSVDSNGAEVTDGSSSPTISADGRFVAFTSSSPFLDLDQPCCNSSSKVFVHDLLTGRTKLVSRIGADAKSPSISEDGGFIAYTYAYGGLPYSDVYVFDRQEEREYLVSVDSLGNPGNRGSYLASISGDGRFVAFYSNADNLVSNDTNETSDVFVHDRSTELTRRVSVDSAGNQGNGYYGSQHPAISFDGRFVVFQSDADNLVPDDANGTTDVFVHDLENSTTALVSVNTAGEQGDWSSFGGSISQDGRYIAFDSLATNLVPDDTNDNSGNDWGYDVFVRDRVERVTVRVSVDSTGSQASDGFFGSADGSISLDGKLVSFGSDYRDLVPGDNNNARDIFVHDRGGVPTPSGNVPQEIFDEAQRMVDVADGSLLQAQEDSEGLLDVFHYYRAAVPTQATEMTLGIVTGVVDTFRGGAAAANGERALKHAFPGVKGLIQLGGQLGSDTLNNPLKSPVACKLSNAGIEELGGAVFSDNAELDRYSQLALRSGLYALAAYQHNTCLSDVTEDLVLDVASLLDGYSVSPFTSSPPALRIADSRQWMQQHLDVVAAATIPPLSPEAIDQYWYDLRTRGDASYVFQRQLTDALATLEAIKAANEAEPLGGEALQIILRSGAKIGAEYLLDGVGRAAVAGSLTLFDSYMNGKALNESWEMLFYAHSTLLNTSPSVVVRVTDNTIEGLQRLASGVPPEAPAGEIGNIDHFSVVDFKFFPLGGWQEEESYSWITIENTGAVAADFHVVTRYLGETTRLEVPWATLWWTASSDPIRLQPGQSVPVRIEYKSGSNGYSPRAARPNVGASQIEIELMAINDTGHFKVDYYPSTWAPQPIVQSNDSAFTFVAQDVAEDYEVIADPLVIGVNAGIGSETQTGYVWVNNPFTATIPISVTQPLPVNATLLDAGGASLQQNELFWTDTIEPLATGFYSYTMSIDSPPGTSVTIPAATLSLTDPDGNYGSMEGDPETLVMPWPVLISRDTPDWIPPFTSDVITVRVTNYSQNQVAGSFVVDIATASGASVTTETLPLSIPDGDTQSLSFTWPGNLDIGDYEVRGTLLSGGSQDELFTDPVAVGAPPPQLDLSVGPIADDGTVSLGQTLVYTFTVEHAGDMPLTNVIAGLAIPSDVQALSISDGGTQVGSEVRWQLANLAIGETRTLTAQILVPTDFVDPNEGRYLESTPFLSSNESPAVTGTALALLVLGPTASQTTNLTFLSGWNMVSLHLTPDNPAMDAIFPQPQRDNLVLCKHDNDVYWPALEINTIGEWDPAVAYQCYTTEPFTVTITGQPIDPTAAMPLVAGWSTIAYWRDSALPIDQALASLGGAVVLVKNNDGEIYWPEYGINTIGNMQPGQGYKMYLQAAATLEYPSN